MRHARVCQRHSDLWARESMEGDGGGNSTRAPTRGVFQPCCSWGWFCALGREVRWGTNHSAAGLAVLTVSPRQEGNGGLIGVPQPPCSHPFLQVCL